MARQVNKETLRSDVKKYLIKEISEGHYKPGERIVETKLAKKLKMSQAPVREAVLELSIMGVLEERPYAGSFVRHPSKEEIDNIYNVRGLIEKQSAKEAAENRTEEHLAGLREILEEMKVCRDKETFAELDHSFHEIIADASGNQMLKRIWTTVSTYELTYQTILDNQWTIPGLYDVHKDLYDVIASGNGPAAEAEMFLHIDRFRLGVLERMERSQGTAN